MPAENLEEQGLPKNPNLELAQWRFLLTTDKHRNDESIKAQLSQAIKADSEYSFDYFTIFTSCCSRHFLLSH